MLVLVDKNMALQVQFLGDVSNDARLWGPDVTGGYQALFPLLFRLPRKMEASPCLAAAHACYREQIVTLYQIAAVLFDGRDFVFSFFHASVIVSISCSFS